MSYVGIAIAAVVVIGVGAGLQAKAASDAGKAADIAAKTKAKQIEFAAKEREIDRRRQLLSALATQNATAAAGGVRAYEGSQLNMLKTDFDTYGYDAAVDRGTTDTNKAFVLFGGRFAKSQSLLQVAGIGVSAAGSLISIAGGAAAGGGGAGAGAAKGNASVGQSSIGGG